MIHITRDHQNPKTHDTAVTIQCDRCEIDSRHVTWAESNDLGSIEVSAGCALAMARQWDRWTIRGRKHYCPKCARKRKEKTR